jgi:hypothetical protein
MFNLLIFLFYLFKHALKFLLSLIDYLVNILERRYYMKITAVIYNDSSRYLRFYLSNTDLLRHREALNGIFYTLKSDKRFLEFGSKKIIFAIAIIDDIEYTYHHNVLIDNNTSFKKYYSLIRDNINNLYDNNYPIDTVPLFKIID